MVSKISRWDILHQYHLMLFFSTWTGFGCTKSRTTPIMPSSTISWIVCLTFLTNAFWKGISFFLLKPMLIFESTLLAYSGPLQSWARMTLSRLMQSSARKGFSFLLTQLVFSWCFWLNYHITFNAFQVWWYPNSTQSVQWRSCHVRKVAKVKDSVAKDQGQEREEA